MSKFKKFLEKDRRKAEEIFEEDKNLLFELANLRTKITGLPILIWVSEKKGKHEARIKVANNSEKWTDDTFSLSISDEPKVIAGECKLPTKDLEKVKCFVKKHKKTLLDYWEREISTDEMLENIKKL